MGEDFIRCYIGNIHFRMLKDIQTESGKFNEWELSQGSDFNLKKSYGYKEDNFIPAHDELLLEALAKRSVIAETKQPTRVKTSIFWQNGGNIADVLTLLSLARARYYPISAIEEKRGQLYSIAWDLIPKDDAGNCGIVSIGNLGGFISEALTYIENNRSKLEESGFLSGIHLFTQAQRSCLTAPSILEMGLYWVSLEVLANTYNDNNGLGIVHKKEQVKRFINDRGYIGSNWDFLDKVVDDWYVIRNTLFHEGSESFTLGVLSMRRQQVRDFSSLVFVEMLQKQEEARKNEIATRMQNY